MRPSSRYLSRVSPTWILAPPLEFRRLLLIVPPCLRNAAGKSGFLWRKAEHVPIGNTMRRQIPMGYPVAPRADHAIERTARRGQLASGFGGENLLDQRIDRWIGDAGAIERARHARRLRGEIRAQRVTRRSREIEALDRDVIVEFIDALAELNRIDDAQGRIDAEHPEVLDEWHVVRLEGRLVDQELDRPRLALRIDALAVLDHVAGLLQQLRRLAQQHAVLARAVGHRGQIRLAEHLVRHLAVERLKQ